MEIENFQIKQIGSSIKLQWKFPQYLSDKKSNFESEKLKNILVYHSLKNLSRKKMSKKSNLIMKLDKDKLSSSDRQYFVDIPFKSKNLENKTHYFAIRYYYHKKKSPVSKIITLNTMIPIKPIRDLKAIKEKKVLKLSWTRPKLNVVNKIVKNISGYNIFKKITGTKEERIKTDFEIINQEAVLHEYFEDTNTSQDGTYYYYVTTKFSTNIESDPSNQVSLIIKDIYPPDPPTNLVSFKAKDHIFLTWEKVIDDDLSHYQIYRRTFKEKEFQLMADKIAENYYKDKNVQGEKLYFYQVTAVDTKGNVSESSNVSKERFE